MSSQNSSINNNEFTSEFFDDASRAWLANKKRVGASYVYMCIHIKSNQTQCKNRVWKNSEFCYYHYKLKEN